MSNALSWQYLQPILVTGLISLVFALLLEAGKLWQQQRRARKEAQEKLNSEAAVSRETILAEMPVTVWQWCRDLHEDNLQVHAEKLQMQERAVAAESVNRALQFKIDEELHKNLILTRENMELKQRVAELDGHPHNQSHRESHRDLEKGLEKESHE